MRLNFVTAPLSFTSNEQVTCSDSLFIETDLKHRIIIKYGSVWIVKSLLIRNLRPLKLIHVRLNEFYFSFTFTFKSKGRVNFYGLWYDSL